MNRYKPRTTGHPTLWQFVLYFGALLVFAYFVGLTVAHWPQVTLWLTYKAPWWFLPLCSLVAFLIVLATAVWSAIREPRS